MDITICSKDKIQGLQVSRQILGMDYYRSQKGSDVPCFQDAVMGKIQYNNFYYKTVLVPYLKCLPQKCAFN